jgi:AmmeMemoRadiSam system protein B
MKNKFETGEVAASLRGNMIRQPAVAGYFYPENKETLEREISSMLPKSKKEETIAVVVPHAGYLYSGSVAGEVYASLDLPDTFIILCPNHTGNGSDFDVYPEGEWLTPLGSAQVDSELIEQLVQRFPQAKKDGRAHVREHSLEVQLPFLQYLKGQIRFLPVCIRQYRYEQLEQLGHVLSDIIRSSNRKILLIASSDMTHYESQESAKKKDQLAIDQMSQLNPRGLYDTVHANNITMCGYLPATVTMIAAKDLGATRGSLVRYATSGDVTKDFQSVVGYAGMRFS